jgi:hypothetical protein
MGKEWRQATDSLRPCQGTVPEHTLKIAARGQDETVPDTVYIRDMSSPYSHSNLAAKILTLP